MEVQMILTDEQEELLQEVVDKFVEVFTEVFDRIKELWDKGTEIFKKLLNSLTPEEVQEFVNSKMVKCKKSYPHSYPQYVDKCKYNSRGFPRPIYKCARSGC